LTGKVTPYTGGNAKKKKSFWLNKKEMRKKRENVSARERRNTVTAKRQKGKKN